MKFSVLGILGFPTHQNFDCTTYDEICKAFLRRSKKLMIKRELDLLAQNSADPKLQKEITIDYVYNSDRNS